jgi:hypothetical protein
MTNGFSMYVEYSLARPRPSSILTKTIDSSFNSSSHSASAIIYIDLHIYLFITYIDFCHVFIHIHCQFDYSGLKFINFTKQFCLSILVGYAYQSYNNI